MIKIEIAQASLPLKYVFRKPFSDQARLVESIYDGIDVHLTRSRATNELATQPADLSMLAVSGIHASARSERISLNPKDWNELPKSPFALIYTLAFLHKLDSLPVIDAIIQNLGNRRIPVTLYPLQDGQELTRVKHGTKLFQLKGELKEQFGIDSQRGLSRFLCANNDYAGVVHDLQHSSKEFPVEEYGVMREVKRAHLSVARTDFEKWDTYVPIEPLLKGRKDSLIYPWLMTLASSHDDMSFVVETKPTFSSPSEWRERHRNIVGTIKRWLRN